MFQRVLLRIDDNETANYSIKIVRATHYLYLKEDAMVYPIDDRNKEETPGKKTRQARTAKTRTAEKGSPNVRPKVAKLIDKVIKENAPTWQELAKR